MHRTFCNCGQYWTHLPGWPITRGDTGLDTGEGISFLSIEEDSTGDEGGITPEGGDTTGERGLRY